MEKVGIVGLDIAKTSFHARGATGDGSKVFSKALARGRVLEEFSRIEPCTVALEACAGAHHWSREISKLGHDVRLIAPHYVKPYVKRQKNDANDAEAIAEAASRPTMSYPAGDACIAERAICRDQVRRATRPGDGPEDPRSSDDTTNPDDQRVARTSTDRQCISAGNVTRGWQSTELLPRRVLSICLGWKGVCLNAQKNCHPK